ncbi:MAG: PQQ-binding-like beta-propeller repeat protein, partial [Candidatus Binatia bacterium]
MRPISRRRFLFASAWAASRGRASRASETASADCGWPSHGYDLRQTRFNDRETRLGREDVGRLRLRWQFSAGGGFTGTPAVAGGRVIVGCWDGNVYALDRRSGRLLWKFRVGTRRYPGDRSIGIYASPAVSGSTVYVASDRLLALSVADGRRLW